MAVPAPDVPGEGLRERHKRSTRAALITAALELFDRRGYERVTVEDICAAADVSPRTFFRYFAQRDDVLIAPITEQLEQVLGDLRVRPDGEGAWASLRASLDLLVGRIEEQHDHFLRMWRIVHASPDSVSANARGFAEWEGAMVGLVAVRMGRPDSDLRPRVLTGVALVAFRHALDGWLFAGGRASLTAVLADALGLAEAGPLALT